MIAAIYAAKRNASLNGLGKSQATQHVRLALWLRYSESRGPWKGLRMKFSSPSRESGGHVGHDARTLSGPFCHGEAAPQRWPYAHLMIAPSSSSRPSPTSSSGCSVRGCDVGRAVERRHRKSRPDHYAYSAAFGSTDGQWKTPRVL